MNRTLIAAAVMVALLAAMVGLYLATGAPPGAGASLELPPKGELTLRLMSWNLGNSVEADFKPARDQDLDHIAGAINESGADIVCLQEIANDRQLQRLSGKLSRKYQSFAAPRRGLHNSARLIVMLVGEEAPVKGWRILECIGGNDVLLVELLPKVFLLGVHADAFDAARRRHTFEAISDWMDDPQRIGSPMVLLGDLNLDVEIAALEGGPAAMHDAESFSLLARRFRDAGARAGPTALGNRRLDYIFVRPHELQIAGAWVWAKQNIGDMDHLPLVVDLGAAAGNRHLLLDSNRL